MKVLRLVVTLPLLAASLTAGAQAPPKVTRVGLLFTGSSPPESSRTVEAFPRGLRELGHVEGQNIVLESTPPGP